MNLKDVKEHVRGQVKFKHYKDGNLYYETDSGLLFPVPIEDIGNATFLAEDKAMLFMRYIKRHIKTLECGAV